MFENFYGTNVVHERLGKPLCYCVVRVLVGTLLPPDDPARLWECVMLLETTQKYSPMLQLLLWKLHAFLLAMEICTQFYNLRLIPLGEPVPA